MLTQQKIAFEKNSAKIGKTITVLIDNKSQEDGQFVGRSSAEAPEVDGAIKVKGEKLRIGRLVRVKIVDWCGYDLIGRQTRK
jgi:ribosomal protein S12 methylthiotransferase